MSCHHAFSSQMCGWGQFLHCVHVELHSSFSFSSAWLGPCVSTHHTVTLLCQFSALFFQLPSNDLPEADSGFCKAVSHQLRLPLMQAAEKLLAFVLSFDGGEKINNGVEYLHPSCLSHAQATICMSRSHVMVLLEPRLPAEHRAALKSSSICIFTLALDYKQHSVVFVSKRERIGKLPAAPYR